MYGSLLICKQNQLVNYIKAMQMQNGSVHKYSVFPQNSVDLCLNLMAYYGEIEDVIRQFYNIYTNMWRISVLGHYGKCIIIDSHI